MKAIETIQNFFKPIEYDYYILKSTRPVKRYLTYYKYIGYTFPQKKGETGPFAAEASKKEYEAFKFVDDHGFESVKAFANHVKKSASQYLNLDFKIIGVKMKNNVIDFVRTIDTDGKGLWSEVSKNVQLTHISLDRLSDDHEFGELRIHFDPMSWDIKEDGLIYTDPSFIASLEKELNHIELAGDDVSYSEQGMQGNDFVSCDVGEEFITSWKAMNA